MPVGEILNLICIHEHELKNEDTGREEGSMNGTVERLEERRARIVFVQNDE